MPTEEAQGKFGRLVDNLRWKVISLLAPSDMVNEPTRTALPKGPRSSKDSLSMHNDIGFQNDRLGEITPTVPKGMTAPMTNGKTNELYKSTRRK